MNNFITISDYDTSIHRDILDSLMRDNVHNDAAIIEICEDRAVSEMRSYLSVFYDCDRIFSMEGEKRHPLILMMAIDIAVYHLFCLHNPYKVSQMRKDRYDRAVEWIKGVAKGTVTIDGAPKLPDGCLDNKSPWQITSNPIRVSHL